MVHSLQGNLTEAVRTYVLKRANKHAKGHTCDKVWDGLCFLWSRSCHTHHAARAKECICRLMHCGALTTRQPDRSCAHVLKRANKHAKGNTCDKVWDGLCILWSRSCHMHHAARAKECICRLMHCGAFTTGQPDRSCAHVLKRANKHAKGHTCDNVWDV